MDQQRRNPHHPPHWVADDAWCALTACTHSRLPLLKAGGYKDVMRERLQALVIEFEFVMPAWVVLDNHYHLLIKVTKGISVGRFVQRLHGAVSHEINKRDHLSGRRMWQNYGDTNLNDKKSFWTRFNYIHHNPVKHGYAAEMKDYEYSSFPYYLRTQGEDWLTDAFRQYPIKDFTDPTDI